MPVIHAAPLLDVARLDDDELLSWYGRLGALLDRIAAEHAATVAAFRHTVLRGGSTPVDQAAFDRRLVSLATRRTRLDAEHRRVRGEATVRGLSWGF
ncbi:MAG: hypothetical protein ACJ73S_27050 [Mycobacteriales bacterium]